MGFWGSLVAARTDEPMEDLLARELFGDDYLGTSELAPGWQLARVGGIPTDLAQAVVHLATTTGAAAFAAVVLDSDCGPVACASPAGAGWQGTFGKASAISTYDMPDDGVSAEDEADALVAWATESGLGLGPDRAVLVEALAHDTSDAEQSLLTLFRGLGISS